MSDEVIDFPEFCAAVRRLDGIMMPSQQRALDALAESEDGPRTVAEWCTAFNDLADAELARVVREVRDVSRAVQRDREERRREDLLAAYCQRAMGRR